jgi:hypothetical protein
MMTVSRKQQAGDMVDMRDERRGAQRRNASHHPDFHM